MKKASKIDFEYICEDILNNERFKSLDKELHHGITRYQHSMHVAKTTYFFLDLFKSKKKNDVTKAALLHDFYNDEEIDEYNAVEKLNVHPTIALKNAKANFNINEIQEDIIVNHMFPSTKSIPKTKYGWLVSFVDKGVAIYEMAHYKAIMQLGVLLLFVFNIISIHN